MTRATATDMDDYIARYPKDVQALLTKMRLTIPALRLRQRKRSAMPSLPFA
jgi:hypothetical protein